MTEWMEEKDRKKLDRELAADPKGGPVSHGTRDLMMLMGMGPPPPPRRPAPETEEVEA